MVTWPVSAPRVGAEVAKVPVQAERAVAVVVEAGTKPTFPPQSQSPAVRKILVTDAAVPLERPGAVDDEVTAEVIISPTYPA